jgi:hypothetical protein
VNRAIAIAHTRGTNVPGAPRTMMAILLLMLVAKIGCKVFIAALVQPF